MFGKNLFGLHMISFVQFALNNNTLPFAEQIRQNAFVGDIHHTFGVIDTEIHLQRLRVALYATGHHHSAHAQALTDFGHLLRFALTVEYLSRRIEQVNIRTQRIKHQRNGQRQTRQYRTGYP